MDDAQYTQEQLAGAIGKPRATVTETLSLTNLPIENCLNPQTAGGPA